MTTTAPLTDSELAEIQQAVEGTGTWAGPLFSNGEAILVARPDEPVGWIISARGTREVSLADAAKFGWWEPVHAAA